jgi:hypothetical protein
MHDGGKEQLSHQFYHIFPVFRKKLLYEQCRSSAQQGTGAGRQTALFQKTGSLDAVICFLMQQTMQDIPPGASVDRDK